MTDEFNFDYSIEQAWRRFSVRLSSVLSMMDNTEPLTLSSCETGSQDCLVFTQVIRGWITARVPTGSGAHALSEEQATSLCQLEWVHDDRGFTMTGCEEQASELADASTRVLREVFHVEHPVFLTSNVLTDLLREPSVMEEAPPGEGLCEQTSVYAYLNDIQLTAAVIEELTDIFGSPPARDQDGDLAIRVGSTMLFVRISCDGTEIRLFAVLVHDITGRSRAAEVLNDVNAHARWVRFSLVRDRIVAAMSIHACPFVPAHLRHAVEEMTKVCDGVDDMLAVSLQGKTTFPDDIS